MDRNAGKPSRELRASLETADIFKRLQEHFLCCVMGIIDVAQKPSQSPKYPPRMPANQLLKSVDVPTPGLAPQGRHPGLREEWHRGMGRESSEKGYKSFGPNTLRGGKSVRCPDARLHSIKEVGQARHHNGLYDLKFGKALRAEPLCLKTLARPPWEAREFAGFVQQGPIRRPIVLLAGDLQRSGRTPLVEFPVCSIPGYVRSRSTCSNWRPKQPTECTPFERDSTHLQ